MNAVGIVSGVNDGKRNSNEVFSSSYNPLLGLVI